MLKLTKTRHTDPLSQTTWQDFESLLATHYRNQGFRVEHVGTGKGRSRYDGGIDLKLRKDDEYILVQCKHWNTRQVPHNAVHELLGIMVNEGATGAIVVTSGEFTKAAIKAATRHGHVKLIDGNELRSMLGVALPAGLPLLRSPVVRLLAVAVLFVVFAAMIAGLFFVIWRSVAHVRMP
jgi:restriction system protein